MLTEAFRSGNINQLAKQFNFQNDPSLRFEKNRSGIYGLTQANRENVLKNMANQMLNTTTYGVGTSAPDPFQKQREELERIKTENKRIFDEYIKNNPPQLGIITGPGGKPPSPGLPPYQDQKLLDQLTKLTPLQASYFDPFDQLSDIDQYNLSLAFPELKSQLRNPNQPRLAVMPDPAELFSRRYGIKDGGRVGMVSGGALKGLMNLFKRGGDDAVDLVKQEEIFREGPITTKFLEDVDDKLIKKFVRTRDTGGAGGYGMYDSFDDMPAGLKAAELISRIKKKGGGINYEAAELFLGKKLKGNESVDELIDIMLTEGSIKSDFADGGRVGFKGGGNQDFPPFKGPKGKKRGFETVMDGPDAGAAARAYLAQQKQKPQQTKALVSTPKPSLENMNRIRESMTAYGFKNQKF